LYIKKKNKKQKGRRDKCLPLFWLLK